MICDRVSFGLLRQLWTTSVVRCGVCCTDKASIIVSRSTQGLTKMMKTIVEVCQAFALTVSAKKNRGHVHASNTYTADDGASRRDRAKLQIVAILHLPGARRDQNPGHVH